MAATDRPTVINITQHNFYNLAGEGFGDILGHELMIHANEITEVDAYQIPTGEFINVQGTPFDFRRLTAVGLRINDDHQQLRFGKGYDHNWILTKRSGELSHAATLIEPGSRRTMEIWTTEQGLQVYSGNFLNGTDKGKSGKTYPYRSGICLEAQYFPDSPNHSNFLLRSCVQVKNITRKQFINFWFPNIQGRTAKR